jgi:uncharacterized protein (TIGR00251 family)
MTTIELRVKPRAKQDRIAVVDADHLDVWVSAPPIDGRANHQVIEVLSEALDIPKRSIEIIRGQSGKNKVVRVEGLTKEEIIKRVS